MPRHSLLLLVASLSVCAPRPSAPPQHDSPAGPPASATPPQPAEPWLERSRLAAQGGALDLAAAHLGRAAALDPTPERLWSHVDALVAAGALRRARAVLERARDDAGRRSDATLRQQIDARLAALPQPAERPLVTTLPNGPLLTAYEADAGGGPAPEVAAAFTAALSDAAEPYHLARAAELLWSRGQQVDARRLWSRARVQLHEAGATVQVIPVELWHTTSAAWRGDSLALLRYLGPISPLFGDAAGALELWPARPGASPTRRFHLARHSSLFAFSADGRTLVRDEGGAVVLQDMLSGTEIRRIAVGDDRVLALAADGDGDGLLVLVGTGSGVTLFTAAGEQKGRWSLAGTTPTITRVYTGEGTHHDNILRDSPTWPVALAMAPGARLVAIGGSDSKLRLVDPARGRVRELAFDWPYTERRPLGANPDLNLPLALRFRDGGAELVAVHTHGDLLIWNTATATLRRRLPGPCAPAEAEPYARRYDEPGTPRRPATAEERKACGHASVAALSLDGKLVASGGALSGARLRDVSSGAPVAMMIDQRLPDQYMSFSPAGELALVDLYGARALWRPGLKQAEPLAAAEPSSPIDPQLSAQGRVLVFQIDHERTVAWDLRERRRLELAAPDERLLALSPDGRLAVVLARGALELRNLATGAVVHRAATTAVAYNIRIQFSKGHVLLDTTEGTARNLVLVDLSSGAARSLPAVLHDRELTLADDGRWIAGYRVNEPLKLWSTATGEHTHTLDTHARRLAFARDGSFVAWLAQDDRSQPQVKLRALSLDNKSPVRELPAEGWPDDIAVAPDNSVLALLQNAKLLRWRPDTGDSRVVSDHWLIGMRRIAVADDGKVVILTGYERIDIRRNDDALTLLAHVFPLLSGGWLAISHAGAIDGSDDAASHLVARVAGKGGEFVAGGGLVWDAVHRDDVVARALAGEDADPPILLPAPPPPK